MVSGSAGLTALSLSISGELPLTTQVGDGIVQIRLPMTGNPLRYINGYLLDDEGGLTLIDCGWKGDDVFAALEDGLAQNGHTLRDVRRLLITHGHFDHYGLAGTLVRKGVPELGMHARDWKMRQFGSTIDSDAEIDCWFERNGLKVEPSDDDEMYSRYDVVEPTRLLDDGEQVGRLRVMWTPGHSPGHLCFVDRVSGRTFTGDHVLDPVTPHVGLWHERAGDPMGLYVESLRKVAENPTTGALPAHGEPFPELAQRVEELLAHEATREAGVLEALSAGPASAYEVASVLRWRRRHDRFDQLPEGHKQFAVAETLAHLERLRIAGTVERNDHGPQITWSLRPAR